MNGPIAAVVIFFFAYVRETSAVVSDTFTSVSHMHARTHARTHTRTRTQSKAKQSKAQSTAATLAVTPPGYKS